jgi:hypothetical protein
MTTNYAKIRANAIVLNPIADPEIPDSMFVEATSGLLTTKKGTEPPAVIATNSAPNVKSMQAFSPIRAGKPVSKMNTGFIVEADSDGTGTQQPIGFSLTAAANANDLCVIILIGTNVAGILAGMGFLPGQEIFLGETSGALTNDISTFSDNNDSLIKLGVADCAAGVASALATDLIIYPYVMARP